MNDSISRRYVGEPLPDGGEDEIDLHDLIGVLLDNLWLIAAITAAALILGLAYIFVATPIYRADGLIQVEEKSAGLGEIEIAELFEGDTSVNAEIEILRSRLVLGTVVENLNLDISAEPRLLPIIGKALARRSDPGDRNSIRVETLELPETLVGEELSLVAGPSSTYELLDSERRRILTGEVGKVAEGQYDSGRVQLFVSQLIGQAGDNFDLKRSKRLKAIDALRGRLVVSEKGKGSGILAVSLEGDDPGEVSRTLNEIANVYVRKNVERKNAEAERTLDFLDEQLPAVKRDMEAAEVALNTYRLEKGSIDLPLETQSILETIVAVEGQLNELRRERERVIQSFTPQHPTIIALDRQIEGLNVDLEELNDQVRELPNTQQEVLRLVRDAQVNTELYTSLLNTAQELRVVKAGTVGNVRIVDSAVRPYAPIKPKKAVILVVTVFAGFLIGILSVMLKRVLHAGVEDPDLIEQNCGVPVYATVGHSKKQDELNKKSNSGEGAPGILAVAAPSDGAIESLRNVQTALHFGMMGAKNNSVMITGPSPGVGKSFVSTNLAAVLTNNDKKVLLIDGDLRRGSLHKYFGLDRKNGLSDFICGRIPIGEALHDTGIQNLTLIPGGQLPPNPAELLMHKRFLNCLNVLSPRYDHIIIDSPPLLAVADAGIISKIAGVSLIVLKAGSHPMREIELSVKRLSQGGANLRGILVNGIDVQSRRYGAGKYVYQYSYGDQ